MLLRQSSVRSTCPSRRVAGLKSCRVPAVIAPKVRGVAARASPDFNGASSGDRLLHAADQFIDAFLPGRDGDNLRRAARSFLNTPEGRIASSAGEQFLGAAADAMFGNSGSRTRSPPSWSDRNADNSASAGPNSRFEGAGPYGSRPYGRYSGDSYGRVVEAAQDLINAAMTRRRSQTARPVQPEHQASPAQAGAEPQDAAEPPQAKQDQPSTTTSEPLAPDAALHASVLAQQQQQQQQADVPAQGKRRKVVSVYMQPAGDATAASAAAPASAAELQQLQSDVQALKTGMQELSSMAAVQNLQGAISNVDTSDSHFEFVTASGIRRSSQSLVKSILLGWMQGRGHMLPQVLVDEEGFHSRLAAICGELTGMTPLVESRQGRSGTEHVMRCPTRFGGKTA